MYIPKAYPCWLYHATLPACVVADHAERESLGDEWATHPDLVPAPAAAAEENAPAEVSTSAKTTSRKRASSGDK